MDPAGGAQRGPGRDEREIEQTFAFLIGEPPPTVMVASSGGNGKSPSGSFLPPEVHFKAFRRTPNRPVVPAMTQH